MTYQSTGKDFTSVQVALMERGFNVSDAKNWRDLIAAYEVAFSDPAPEGLTGVRKRKWLMSRMAQKGLIMRYGMSFRYERHSNPVRGALSNPSLRNADDGKPKEREQRVNKATAYAFYKSDEWRGLRLQALEKHGRRCMACGIWEIPKRRMHVDHIYPVRHYWHLRNVLDNLQILCGGCNRSKGSRNHINLKSLTDRQNAS